MVSKSNDRQERHDALNLLYSITGYSDLLQENAVEKGQEGFLPDLENISLAAHELLAYVEDGALEQRQPPEKALMEYLTRIH